MVRQLAWWERPMSRRDATKILGIAAPATALVGCGSSMVVGDDAASALDAGGLADAAELGDASTVLTDASAADAFVATTDAAAAADAGAAATAWATGGTAAMTASASYPSPFTAAATSCELFCQATIGPCHTGTTERRDVSDGWDGLPVRLSLRILDEGCAPISDAIVEIWHTNYHGIYSGQINAMCNSATEDRQATYFRGYQRTDADGIVHFDTVFPGWYSGRAIHIHFRVMTGTYQAADNATAEVVSQLFFDEALISSIFSGEPLYSAAGQPDTSNDDDNVVGGEADLSPYVLDTARMTDGAMQASKTIILRSTSATLCTLAGSGGGGGGPPGGR